LTGIFVEADIITETAMAFAVPSRAVVETDSNLYVLVLEKEKNGIYHFSQKEVVVDAQYNGYSALKNAQEFNPQTQFLIKGAFKLLEE
jgi:cobalt-zinc-cadmium efflux system membrane fusion protein